MTKLVLVEIFNKFNVFHALPPPQQRLFKIITKLKTIIQSLFGLKLRVSGSFKRSGSKFIPNVIISFNRGDGIWN